MNTSLATYHTSSTVGAIGSPDQRGLSETLHVGLRTDGHEGCGSPGDPFDGSSALKLIEIIGGAPGGSEIVVNSGVYEIPTGLSLARRVQTDFPVLTFRPRAILLYEDPDDAAADWRLFLGEARNIEWFGASPDAAAAVNFKAILCARNSLAPADGGSRTKSGGLIRRGEITIPQRGPYLIDDTIVLSGTTVIRGRLLGGGAAGLRFADHSAPAGGREKFVLEFELVEGYSHANFVHDTAVVNLVVDSTDAGNEKQSGILFRGSQLSFLDGVWIFHRWRVFVSSTQSGYSIRDMTVVGYAPTTSSLGCRSGLPQVTIEGGIGVPINHLSLIGNDPPRRGPDHQFTPSMIITDYSQGVVGLSVGIEQGASGLEIRDSQNCNILNLEVSGRSGEGAYALAVCGKSKANAVGVNALSGVTTTIIDQSRDPERTLAAAVATSARFFRISGRLPAPWRHCRLKRWCPGQSRPSSRATGAFL